MSKKGNITEIQKLVEFLLMLITTIIRELRWVFQVAMRSVHKAKEEENPNSTRALDSEYEFGCSPDSVKTIIAGLEHGGYYPGISNQSENQDS